MNNDSIQFGEPIDPEVPQEFLPPLELLAQDVRTLRETSFQVYIVKEAHAAILGHVFESRDIESGGLLVGHPFKSFTDDITFVVVTAAIPQRSQDRSRIHFTIGPNESAEARRLLAAKYPGQVVVGWYHSHPGHGVFLSRQDKAIARSIYNLPWHIAIVIDPLQSAEAIFIGKEGTRLSTNDQDKLGSSWISLEKTPDSIKAIALYNQIKEGHDRLDQLTALVKSSGQLGHWRSRYRDLPLPSSPGLFNHKDTSGQTEKRPSSPENQIRQGQSTTIIKKPETQTHSQEKPRLTTSPSHTPGTADDYRYVNEPKSQPQIRSSTGNWLKFASIGGIGMILTAVICAFGTGLLYSNPDRFFGLFFTPTPTPTSTSTATPTFTSTATATPTSTGTATHTATATATATSTNTTTPTGTPDFEEAPQSPTSTSNPLAETPETITNTGEITTTSVITNSSDQE